MRVPRVWLLLALVSVLSGCFNWSVLYSEQPLGEQVAVFEADEWDGAWLDQKGEVASYDVSPTDTAVLLMTSRGPDRTIGPLWDCKRVRDTEHPIPFRQTGRWYFPVLKLKDEDGLYGLLFAMFRHGDTLLVYEPDLSQVRKLIEDGALPGRVENERVILEPLASEHYKVLLSDKRGAFLGKPRDVAVKLPNELDPCAKAEPIGDSLQRTFLIVDADDLRPIWGARLGIEPCDDECQRNPSWVFPDQPRGDSATTNRQGKVTLNLPSGYSRGYRYAVVAPDRIESSCPQKDITPRPKGIAQVIYMCREPCAVAKQPSLCDTSRAAIEWVKLGTSSEYDGDVYADSSKISRWFDEVTMWDVTDYHRAIDTQKGPIRSHKSLREYHCKDKRLRVLSIFKYRENMGRGELVDRSTKWSEWMPVEPASNSEVLFKFACKR